jgi:tetratricopeptide (TPR) repeat protein
MAKKKVTRKELLDTQDDFITYSQKAISFLVTYSNQFLIGLVVILALALAIMGARYYFARQAREALIAYDRALAQVAQIKSMSDENNPQESEAAIQALEHVRSAYSRSAPARFVLLDLGALYFHLKRYDQAKDSYQKYLKNIKAEEEYMRPLILDSLAYISEAEKDLEKAAARWEEVTKLANEFLKEEAFFNLGRIYEVQNNKAKAIEIYEKLMADYPDSSNTARVKAKLTGLSAGKSE